jgi:hypothetical protein
MKPPLSIRPFTDEERAALEAGLRSHEAFTVGRCQILLASAEARKPAVIAKTLPCAPQRVWNVIHAFDARGLACMPRGSNVPVSVEPVLNAEKREQVRAILHQRPRTFGQPACVWTRTRLANVCHEQGLSEPPLSAPTMLDAMVRLGAVGSAPNTGLSVPTPRTREKKRRDQLIRLAATNPDQALGFEDAVWWSPSSAPQAGLE